MILIPSSSFIKIEIQNEVGALPPAFLFLQNERLYKFQIELLRKYWPKEQIVLSIPHAYKLNNTDKTILNNLEVEIFRNDDSKQLGKSISDVIGKFSPKNLKILHGDTYFYSLPEIPNNQSFLVVSEPIELALWDSSSVKENDGNVWAGFFYFSDPGAFYDALKKESFSFRDAVISFAKSQELKEIKVSPWFDFGHLEGFHKSRERFTTQRVFNKLEVNKYEVIKSSNNSIKIKQEFLWFSLIPGHIKKFTPNVYEFNEDGLESSYKISYIHGFSVSELMLFSNLGKKRWTAIFNEISLLLHEQQNHLPSSSYDLAKKSIKFLLNNKSISRINEIYEKGFLRRGEEIYYAGALLGSLETIVSSLIDLVEKYEPLPCFAHGDLCLSNIIYKARGNTISIIDPRGINSKDDLVGDQRYDIAKLSHSIFWDYDRVISGEVSFKRDKNYFEPKKSDMNPNQEILKKLFLEDVNLSLILRDDIKALTALLFITMIPLHYDSLNRMNSLFAVGLKIYYELTHNKG